VWSRIRFALRELKSLLRQLPPGVKVFLRRSADRLRGQQPPALLAKPLVDLPPLRCGIIGAGTMGRQHAEVLRAHPYVRLAGFASSTPRPEMATEFSCRWFESADAMIGSGEVDAVIIATPHWQHCELAVSALRAGKHVLCEKPLTVTPTQAAEVLSVAQASRGTLTCVSQTRCEPAWLRAHAVLTSGELGAIRRSSFEETFWRTDAYFRSAPWRGTWKGEGGGVLINQAPHVLDRYVWLCGMPERVTAFCDASLHATETEDTASALFHHENSAHGHLHVSTAESPPLPRTVIVCDRGRIVVEQGRMRISRFAGSLREHAASAKGFFDELPEASCEDVGALIVSAPVLLSRFYENFALAVAGREPLLVPASDGARVVKLASAIRLSAHEGRTLTLPIDAKTYDDFLAARS